LGDREAAGIEQDGVCALAKGEARVVTVEVFQPPVRYEFLSVTPIFLLQQEAIKHPYAYQTYQIIINNKFTDSNGYLNFSFTGHGRNRVGDEASMLGSGYKHNNQWHLEYKASLFQTSQGNAGPYGIYPVYQLNAIWDFFDDSLQQGRAVRFNDITNSNLIKPSAANNELNDYDIGLVNRISCKLYLRLVIYQ
jgi:hypothetical protein